MSNTLQLVTTLSDRVVLLKDKVSCNVVRHSLLVLPRLCALQAIAISDILASWSSERLIVCHSPRHALEGATGKAGEGGERGEGPNSPILVPSASVDSALSIPSGEVCVCVCVFLCSLSFVSATDCMLDSRPVGWCGGGHPATVRGCNRGRGCSSARVNRTAAERRVFLTRIETVGVSHRTAATATHR